MREKLRRFCRVPGGSKRINGGKLQGARLWLSPGRIFHTVEPTGRWNVDPGEGGAGTGAAIRVRFYCAQGGSRSNDSCSASDEFLWLFAVVAYVLEVWQDCANGHVNGGSWPEHPARFLIKNRKSEKTGCFSFTFYCYLKGGSQGPASTFLLPLSRRDWEGFSSGCFTWKTTPLRWLLHIKKRMCMSFTFRYSIHHPFLVWANSGTRTSEKLTCACYVVASSQSVPCLGVDGTFTHETKAAAED